jgi:hypothetical protein
MPRNLFSERSLNKGVAGWRAMCGVDFTALSFSQRVFAVILEDHIPSNVGLARDIK